MCFTHNSKNSNYSKFNSIIKNVSFTNGGNTGYNVSTASGCSTITTVISVIPYGTHDKVGFSVTNGNGNNYTISLTNLSTTATKTLNLRIVYTYT